MNIYKVLFDTIVNILAVDPELVVPGASLLNDLGTDDTDKANLEQALEAEFKISIPDDKWEKFETVVDIFNYLIDAVISEYSLEPVIITPSGPRYGPYPYYENPDPKDHDNYPYTWPNAYRYGDPNSRTNPNYYPSESSVTNRDKKIAVGISWALKKVEMKVPYLQQHGNLRTANTPEALAYMDCSEMVCRYLKEIGLTNSVIALNTAALKDYVKNPALFNTVTTPQAGDIYLWLRDSGGGHTGIVRSYDPATGVVTYLHETSWGNIHFAQQGSARLNSTTFISHDGWKGFYRPKI